MKYYRITVPMAHVTDTGNLIFSIFVSDLASNTLIMESSYELFAQLRLKNKQPRKTTHSVSKVCKQRQEC